MNTSVASLTTNDCVNVSFFIVEAYQVDKFKMDEYIFINMYHLLKYCGGKRQTDRHHTSGTGDLFTLLHLSRPM